MTLCSAAAAAAAEAAGAWNPQLVSVQRVELLFKEALLELVSLRHIKAVVQHCSLSLSPLSVGLLLPASMLVTSPSYH